MNVLSLFDGLSGGRIALDRLGIKVDNYYSSEIDKYAIQVSTDNYPDIIRLGSIIDLTEEQLLALPKIDLLIGGSPCQGFSLAGHQKGSSTKEGIDVVSLEQYLDLKEQGFEFNGQSYLFW
ncbi:MAG: DNA (cytosine-5-)-methyltransferase, partial [Candidatus Cloacimonadota bacterium]